MRDGLPNLYTPNAVDRHVGSRVRERRLELKMSVERLAELLDVTVEEVIRYENGQEHIGAARLWLVGLKLNVSVHYFFMGVLTKKANVIPFPKRKA